MTLDSRKLKFIQTELKNQSLNDVWMRLLKTYIAEYATENDKEDFSNNEDFKMFKKFDTNILSGLSLIEISLFYEYSLAIADRDRRKQSGAYYTPEDIALFMAEKSKHFEKNKRWLDPCSGVGNLSYHLADVQDNSEHFVQYNLILQDIDELALKIAHCIFALHFQNKIEGFYEKISNNFIVKNFLDDYDKHIHLNDGALINTSTTQKKMYDYVIVNPPYFSAKQDHRFITSESRDLYGYFLERIIFESEGFISITPQSFTNSSKFAKLRNILIENMNDFSIYAFDNMPDSVFKGYKYGSENSNTANSVRASIIIAKKSETISHKITPLLRWRTSERQAAIQKADEQLTDFSFQTNQLFPKLSKDTAELYSTIIQHKNISSIFSSNKTKYSLIVPSTPRYYITASKTPLNRSSFHTLYFKDEEAQNKAYILLNSSYMYWWWRVNDGGMTLSKETLFSLPLLDFDINERGVKELIKDLKESELLNKVSKANAGKESENIKHPKELIIKINKSIIKDEKISLSLYESHSNSFVNE